MGGLRASPSLSTRDEARRSARASANRWRAERGYECWPEYGTYTDYVTPFVLLALNIGLRRGELLQLQWRDVDLTRKLLTVRGEGAKTGQTRYGMRTVVRQSSREDETGSRR